MTDMTNEQALEKIEADLAAYRSGWLQYDRDHVRQLQSERRKLLAECSHYPAS